MRRGLAPAALLLLAACGPAAEPGAGNSNEGRTAAAAPVADGGQSSANFASPEPQAAAAVLTAEGYGPLRIGMTLAQVNAALGPDSDPAEDGGPEPEHCDQFRPARAPEGLIVMIEEGRLTRISLDEGSPVATDKGLRAGATAAAVRAAYGAELRSEPHEYESPEGEYLTIWTRGAPAPDAAADPAARGLRYEVSMTGRVAAIHAGGPSIQYVEGCL